MCVNSFYTFCKSFCRRLQTRATSQPCGVDAAATAVANNFQATGRAASGVTSNQTFEGEAYATLNAKLPDVTGDVSLKSTAMANNTMAATITTTTVTSTATTTYSWNETVGGVEEHTSNLATVLVEEQTTNSTNTFDPNLVYEAVVQVSGVFRHAHKASNINII